MTDFRTEKEFTRWFLKQARLRGWEAAHFNTSQRTVLGRDGSYRSIPDRDAAGFPDVVLARERVLFVELKMPKAKPRPNQARWIDALRAAGAEVHIWYPKDADEILDVLDGRPSGSRLFPIAGPLEALS